MNSKETSAYLSQKKFKIRSYFYLTGSWAYTEVILWTLIGVIISLIYYVAKANRNKIKNVTSTSDDDSDDIGAFDSAEIPDQVAKMFYAPVCTLVIVLGYSFISSNNKMIDISVNKGLILFSFIAGFYSGRVMKFLDGLKDLIFPLTKSAKPAPGANSASSNNLSVSLVVPDSLATDLKNDNTSFPDLKSASVSLVSEDGKTTTPLNKPTDQNTNAYSLDKVAFGKYTINANVDAKKNDSTNGTKVTLRATKEIEINADKQEYTIELQK